MKGNNPDFTIASFIFMILLAQVGCQSNQGHFEPPQSFKSKPADKYKAPDFQLRDLKGKTVSLSNLKGKVVFLDFWATWCPPCIISAPQIDQLAREYNNKNVEVLSISLDQDENLVRQFIRQAGIQNRVVLGAGSDIDVSYKISLLPQFFIIDQDGYVTSTWKGFHPTMVDSWRNEFNRLLES